MILRILIDMLSYLVFHKTYKKADNPHYEYIKIYRKFLISLFRIFLNFFFMLWGTVAWVANLFRMW